MSQLKVSEEFENAFTSHNGGCVRDCQCGRVYFDGYNSYDWEDGELEGSREKAAKDKKYIERDYSIGTYIINGVEVVIGCECNFGRKYEDFLLAYSESIAEYLNKVTENKIKEAAARTKIKL